MRFTERGIPRTTFGGYMKETIGLQFPAWADPDGSRLKKGVARTVNVVGHIIAPVTMANLHQVNRRDFTRNFGEVVTNTVGALAGDVIINIATVTLFPAGAALRTAVQLAAPGIGRFSGRMSSGEPLE